MSVKIRVSFITQKELQGVLALLSPRIKSYKVKKGAEGQYSKAYIENKE